MFPAHRIGRLRWEKRKLTARGAAGTVITAKLWTLNTLANAKVDTGFCGPKGAHGATRLLPGQESNARLVGAHAPFMLCLRVDSWPGRNPVQKPVSTFAFAHG